MKSAAAASKAWRMAEHDRMLVGMRLVPETAGVSNKMLAHVLMSRYYSTGSVLPGEEKPGEPENLSKNPSISLAWPTEEFNRGGMNFSPFRDCPICGGA